MKTTLKWISGALALLVLAGTLASGIAEGLSLTESTEPFEQKILLGLGVFALLCMAYGILNHPPEEKKVPAKQDQPLAPEEKTLPSPPRPDTLSGQFNQLKTYIDLEMWELALDRAEHILEMYPESKEATALQRNINDIRWKAEPKFVDRKQKVVSEAEARRLKEEGMSRFVQHIRTYMELEMWELAKQKASALMKSFPESDAAQEVARLWPEIESHSRKPVSVETKE